MLVCRYLLLCEYGSTDSHSRGTLHGLFNQINAVDFPASRGPFAVAFELTALRRAVVEEVSPGRSPALRILARNGMSASALLGKGAEHLLAKLLSLALILAPFEMKLCAVMLWQVGGGPVVGVSFRKAIRTRSVSRMFASPTITFDRWSRSSTPGRVVRLVLHRLSQRRGELVSAGRLHHRPSPAGAGATICMSTGLNISLKVSVEGPSRSSPSACIRAGA